MATRRGRTRAGGRSKSGTRRVKGRAGTAPPPLAPTVGGPSIVSQELRRFPWPADSRQRFSDASPWLAVVNARGPWGVWQHYREAPKWLPWCRSLWEKRFWREADDGLKVFCWQIWQHMADANLWGIVWGDPARLRREWQFDSATFSPRLEAMIQAGWLVYLTDAERDAAMAWGQAKRTGGNEGGKPEGERGSLERGERGQGQQTGTGDSDRGQQTSDPQARAKQISDSRDGQGQETATATGTVTVTVTGTPGTGHSTQPQAREPANLPKSDHGAAKGAGRATGHAKGLPERPPSVPARKRDGDAVPLADLLGWNHPDAVTFGRRMYEAIHGRKPPEDLMAAHNGDKADVGVWVHWWFTHVRTAIEAAKYSAFANRCFGDVSKKRGCRAIVDLGKVAMGSPKPGAKPGIVPGILASMSGK